ncbi:hypothetical protein PIGHUM_03701 [Pigmentiphaga humi]|uniref:NrtR DNA-binding winged helix domain-containing protein n=1 Tax=Pigmentiphaga humi TaxID=2478468 RepID=A0A3P4B8Y7_9BURK|nr:hypothetical protein [Pigmentiphaga humi]VCU71615.1 hypothetical protein PIGHUM_03701 [Pigmentiphaga humi]
MAELVAVLVAATDAEPLVLTTHDGSMLPSGAFESGHRSLQAGLRAWVEEQTHHPLGYVEQLYTFADRDRTEQATEQRVISISYLALTRQGPVSGADAAWHGWYRYFPWEDRRSPSAELDAQIAAALQEWCRRAPEPEARRMRAQRAEVCFGLGGRPWNEELVLQRYELLFEAGLAQEATRRIGRPGSPHFGQPMHYDHRRILATGIARLRAKIKYRPVVFELMPPTFTLLQLQQAVEALAGRSLHKQNFRRLIEQQQLVEETGALATETAGRPAKLFRFRGDVLLERALSGSKLPLARGN